MTHKEITSGEWLVRTVVDDSGDHPWYDYTVFSYPYEEKRMGHHVICECSTNKADAELIASAPKLLTTIKELKQTNRELLFDNINLREVLLEYVSITEFDEIMKYYKEQEYKTEFLEGEQNGY